MAQITEAYRISALRRGIVVKSNRASSTPEQISHAAFIELANLGFMAKPGALAGMSAAALTAMLSDARKVIGADRAWTPIYPGFPKQVEELSTLTLLVEQILHYWTGGAFLPDYPTIAREGLPLEDMLRNVRAVEVLSAAETARELTRQLATNPVALSEDDRALLEGSIQLQHPDLELIAAVAKDARNGENLQLFVEYAYLAGSFSADQVLAAVAPFTDNTDQLLRVVLALASTAAAPKWEDNYKLAVGTLADRHARAVRLGKVSRPTRRLIVKRLGELTRDFKADNLVTRQELWRGVLKAVHPYDFTLSDAQKRAVDIVHSNIEYRTLNSLVEEAMEKGKVKKATKLLAEHQPGNLLRRAVALLRLVKSDKDAEVLADAIRKSAVKSTVTTLISSYNGIIGANDEHARVTRVAGLTNTMIERSAVVKVKKSHVKLVAAAVKDVLRDVLATKPAPSGAVAVDSKQGVPLVRRDASTADRVLDRGQEIGIVGEGDVLRVFGHWNNNQRHAGYMDIGVVILDSDFNQIAVTTWDTWPSHRSWSTYSGDKLVYPGDSAPEFMDIKLKALRKQYPKAKWAAMTVQSWSGWPIADVDFIAGAMLRSSAEKGEVFDARAVTTAFKPTTISTQSVPFAVNLDTGVIVWIDSSNGSTASGTSSSGDTSIGSIVYDEIQRPRLTFGELATLWAEAHKAKTTKKPIDRDQLLALLG